MNKDKIFEIIKNNILEIMDELPNEAIKNEISLKELGANSIDRVEIITMSMEDLRLKIPLVDFAGIKNIGGLVAFFDEKS
jgi:polyketide biosynthesis acyl carrier protein